MKLLDVIKRPIVTEKVSSPTSGEGNYSFEVDLKANKIKIRKAIEQIFQVKVAKIRTIVVKGKTRRILKTKKEIRLPNWKKAVVQLKAGQKIDLVSPEPTKENK